MIGVTIVKLLGFIFTLLPSYTCYILHMMSNRRIGLIRVIKAYRRIDAVLTDFCI